MRTIWNNYLHIQDDNQPWERLLIAQQHRISYNQKIYITNLRHWWADKNNSRSTTLNRNRASSLFVIGGKWTIRKYPKTVGGGGIREELTRILVILELFGNLKHSTVNFLSNSLIGCSRKIWHLTRRGAPTKTGYRTLVTVKILGFKNNILQNKRNQLVVSAVGGIKPASP